MSILAINGVGLPIKADSLRGSYEEVGSNGRNARGHRLMERRRVKSIYEFDLNPRSLDEAMMLRSLILGEGEFWSVAGGVFGGKGLQLTGSGLWNGGGGGNPISTNGVFRLTASQTMTVPARFYDQTPVSSAAAGLTGATLIAWRFDGSAYRLAGFSWRALETTVAVKREKLGALGSSGAAQAYTGTETLAVSSGNLTLTAPGAGGPWSWSNIMVYPWFLPAAQVDQLLDGHALITYVLPALPRVYVTGDLLPLTQHVASGAFNQNSLICHGELDGFDAIPLARNGTFATELALSGRLIEV